MQFDHLVLEGGGGRSSAVSHSVKTVLKSVKAAKAHSNN